MKPYFKTIVVVASVLIIIFSFIVITISSEGEKTSKGISSVNIAESSIVGNTSTDNSQPGNLPAGDADFYLMPPTKYNRLTEQNIPSGIKTLDKLSIRATPGEYEPLSFLISAKNKMQNVAITITDLSGTGGKISASALNPYIVKVWYQAGIKFNENKDRILTQELLIKNDNLIKIDENNKTNLLLVKDSGTEKYVDVMTLNENNQDNLTVEDSKTLQPFTIEKGRNKQIWIIAHIPMNSTAGTYSGTVSVSANNALISSFPIQIEVLPFKLDQSRLIYGMYYHGYVDNNTKHPMNYTNKTEAQYRIEMEDLKEHGIMYPTTYQVYQNLDKDLQIRNEVGLPKDRLFSVGLKTGNPQGEGELKQLKDQVRLWYDKIHKYGYKELFVYGIDEARGEQLKSQRKAWQAVREAGGKVFVAGYYDTYDDMGDILNAAVVQKEPEREQAEKYHSKGNLVLNYSNPQAGEENPEIYRRNFGFLLWANDYDGAMEYAYQKNYGSEWNDWDHKKYRDQNFTYALSSGILSTIQWEGYREAIDDVRYISTLINRIDDAEKRGKNVSDLRSWVNSINPNGDLDQIRSQIIDKILSLQ